MSATGLPHNGEAQLAEVRRADGSTAILFDGRSKKAGYPRGIAWSYTGGASFTDIRFADDLSAGTSCLASVLSLDQQPVVGAAAGANGSSLLFSHPSRTNRSAGVLLRSDDDAVRTRHPPRIADGTEEGRSSDSGATAGDLDGGELGHAGEPERHVRLQQPQLAAGGGQRKALGGPDVRDGGPWLHRALGRLQDRLP